MPLAPATRLGPYETVAPLGAGGISEVYRSRARLLSTLVALGLLSALALAGCANPSRSSQGALPISGLRWIHVPDTTLNVEDSIEGLDFLAGPGGDVDLVWCASMADSPRPGLHQHEVWHRRGNVERNTWGEPHLIEREDGEAPRLLRLGDELHVLFGGRLRHFVSTDDGASWTELAPLVAARGVRVISFDAMVVGSSLVVAFVARDVGGISGLWVVRWQLGVGDAPVQLGAFEDALFQQPSPRLLGTANRMHLFAGINRLIRMESEAGGRVVEHSRGSAGIVHFASRDQGLTWSPLADVLEPPSDPAVDSGTGTGADIVDVDACSFQGRLLVFYDSHGIFCRESHDYVTWSASVDLAPFPSRQFAASRKSESVTAALLDSGGAVLWIDTRYRRTDRNIANPLGGFPWSDQPDWANNDVLEIPLGPVLRSGLRSDSPQPRRITPDLFYASGLRARASGRSVHVLVAGRVKVGKRLDAHGSPPGLFLVTLPAE